MIPVTQSFLPPQQEYQQQLQRIWESGWLTNRGQLVLELEAALKSYLNIPHILLTNNGTIPLQIALHLLGRGGEVITTPFSYVATTSSIIWEGLIPVFVDIHPEYLTIDEEKIEQAITPNSRCLLATHVYGNPCNVEVLAEICRRHNLLLIYDAAHTFGVEYKESSLYKYGDISTCSFHATKVFHTAEGGALICANPEWQHRLFYSHNFGHKGPYDFHGPGINAKMSELSAAMGLTVLPHITEIIKQRQIIADRYLNHLDQNRYQFLRIREHTKWNASYFPVIFSSEEALMAKVETLNKRDIFPRRYFYPSLNTLPYLPSCRMPVSEDISKRILCLPLYPSLKEEDQMQIIYLMNHEN